MLNKIILATASCDFSYFFNTFPPIFVKILKVSVEEIKYMITEWLIKDQSIKSKIIKGNGVIENQDKN